jgi:hypothetical protein
VSFIIAFAIPVKERSVEILMMADIIDSMNGPGISGFIPFFFKDISKRTGGESHDG